MNHMDAINAMLEGQATAKEWEEEFMATWYEPIRRVMLKQMWAQIDDATKAAMKEQRPDVYEAMRQEVEDA